jgi:hypothetical protein
LQVTESAADNLAPKDGDPSWALLERIVNSPRFQRAARLREFLLYVGRRCIQEHCDQISEQEIGTEVFGRPPNYDTNIDNIVRVNATEVRKRVEAYFEAEGAQEPVILEIPRGSYKPMFRNRAAEPSPAPTMPEPERPQEAPASLLDAQPEPAATRRARSKNRSGRIATAVIILALSSACVALWIQNRNLHRSLYVWESNPVLASFWSQILEAGPKTDVVLADTSFALIEDILKKPIPLKDYLDRRYVSQIQSGDRTQQLSQDRRDDLNLILARNYGSVGDFRVAQRIAALDPLARNIRVNYALEYTAALLKQDNVILIGSRKSNPWVDLFASGLNFTVEYDPDRGVSQVRNGTPRPGEQEAYSAPPPPDSSSGYSVVSYLPNPGQAGKVLIIAGTGSEATEGAGEFITSEEQLANFQKLLHVDKLPYFEVVLKTTHLSATPLNSTIVAYRIYPAR